MRCRLQLCGIFCWFILRFNRMSRLEDLVCGCTVRGILPSELVTIISNQWFGDSVVEVTYKSASGRVDNTLLYRDDESRLEVSQKTKPWSFNAPGSTFRLVSEAYRIHLAALFDPLLAVHTSLVPKQAYSGDRIALVLAGNS